PLRPAARQVAAPHRSAHARRLGRQRRGAAGGLRDGHRGAHQGGARVDDRRLRPSHAPRPASRLRRRRRRLHPGEGRMKFFFMTLMPYGALDLKERAKFTTAWVTLPNRLYDSEKGRALYERYIGELVRADQLGFDGVCVNEHHQTAYGMMPSPIVIA